MVRNTFYVWILADQTVLFPTIVSSCTDKNTRSSITFGFTISCQAAMYTLLADISWASVFAHRLVPHCHTTMKKLLLKDSITQAMQLRHLQFWPHILTLTHGCMTDWIPLEQDIVWPCYQTPPWFFQKGSGHETRCIHVPIMWVSPNPSTYRYCFQYHAQEVSDIQSNCCGNCQTPLHEATTLAVSLLGGGCGLYNYWLVSPCKHPVISPMERK